MEEKKEVIIYMNKKKYAAKNLLLSQTLEKLRMELEKEIPNAIYFMNKDKFIKPDSENDLALHDIIEKNNCVNLQMEYFHVFLDGKESKKNINIFKKDSFQKLKQEYSSELPKKFYIRCESNVLISVNASCEDNSILIEDILIGNSINLFSKKEKVSKTILESGSLGLLIKLNGSIMFRNIQFNKLEIFESLMFDDVFMKNISEPEYELSRKKSLEEYDQYKKGTPNLEKLENIIANNNTSEKAIFDYLLMLKDRKELQSKFQEKLNIYAYLLNIEQLKKLDKKFENNKFKEYKDEKSNLINYLNNVVNGWYDEIYDDVNSIINEINFRDIIEKDIPSPFMYNFNKDNYINIPIMISDNNLFFHYLRVKYYRFLGESFENYIEEYKKYCKILLKKINNASKEKSPKLKQKILLEILCMICLFGHCTDEKINREEFYDHGENVSKEYYPIIFFSTIKDILFDYFKMIGSSKCLDTALNVYKEKINKNAKKHAKLDIKNSYNNLMKNTVFLPFFAAEHWGLTIPAFNLSFINIDIFNLQEINNYYPDYVFLFYITKFIITFLHEPIGHNFKMYESPFEIPRAKKDEKEFKVEGGYLMEFLLINSVDKLNIEHILFLLNEKNWELDHDNFLNQFKSIKSPTLESCMAQIKDSKIVKKLFKLFQINETSIKKAIESKIELPTNINERFNGELMLLSPDKKYRKNKGNTKENKGRICETHSYY